MIGSCMHANKKNANHRSACNLQYLAASTWPQGFLSRRTAVHNRT